MAITTFEQALAGMLPPEDFIKVGATMEAAGVMHSLFYTSGRPGAASAPAPGLAGASLTSYTGQIPFTNAPASKETRLARLQATASASGCLLVYDRLWHNSGLAVTTTTAQTINSTAFPARDRNGSADGAGVIVGIEVSTATTNGSAVTNTTMSYTNQDGTASRTATISSFPATAVAGTFVPFQLQAGDTGIRSIQSVTLGTSYGAGAIHLVALRILARLELPTANTGNALDVLTSGFVRLFDNTVPGLLWVPSGTGAVTVTGHMIMTQG